MTNGPLDLNAHYAVDGCPGVAFYIDRYGTEEYYEGDELICDDAECDHTLSEMCWAEGDTSILIDYQTAIVVMVGDDREHVVDTERLTPLDDDDYCGVCGQIGCTHDGRAQ